MKAVVAQSPGVVAVQDVPEPRMGEYDALCAVLASAVCSGTDKNIVHNHPYHKARYPLVLGHEGVGRVIALGPKVRNLKIGDMVTRVINDIPGFHAQYGALAERALVRDWQAMKEDNVDGWQRHTIHRVLPEGFDPIDATLIITWRETFAYFSRMKPKARERLLIIGSGANALAFANHGKNAGLKVVVIGSQKRKELFESIGVDIYLSYHIPDIASQLSQTEFDMVIDAIGNQASLNVVIPLLAPQGRMGIYGLDEGLNFSKTRGDVSYFHPEEYDEGGAHDSIMQCIKENKLNAWSYLSRDHIYQLDDAAQAFEAAWSGKAIKSVVIP
mgnify:FL=1